MADQAAVGMLRGGLGRGGEGGLRVQGQLGGYSEVRPFPLTANDWVPGFGAPSTAAASAGSAPASTPPATGVPVAPAALDAPAGTLASGRS
jgi:hypothetical protein